MDKKIPFCTKWSKWQWICPSYHSYQPASPSCCDHHPARVQSHARILHRILSLWWSHDAVWLYDAAWCSLMQLDAPLEHKVHRLCPSSHRFHVKPAQRWPKDPFQDKHSMKMEYWVHCYTATHWHADNRPAHAIQERFHPWCHGSRTSSHRGMEASRQASRRTDITRMV